MRPVLAPPLRSSLAHSTRSRVGVATLPRRFASSSSSPRGPRGTRYGRMALLGGVAVGISLPFMPSSETSVSPSLIDDMEVTPRTVPYPIPNSLSTATTTNLIRSYLVYTACSFPSLIDHAPGLLHALTHSYIPGLRGITEAIVRRTFFAQFVPGETVDECLPEMERLRDSNIGTVLNYSAEAECENAADVKRAQEARLKEVYLAIRKSAEFEDAAVRRGGYRGNAAFALKITGLIDPDVLARASATILRLRQASQVNSASSPKATPAVLYPGTPQHSDYRVIARDAVTDRKAPTGESLLQLKGAVPGAILAGDEGLRAGDLEELDALWKKLRDLADYALDKRVSLLIDAEHTWYQPALDAYTLLLSEMYNRPGINKVKDGWIGPCIYGTYQSYLTRQPAHLAAAIKHAEDNGYTLGIKVVRGAYFVQERKRWIDDKRDGPDPIWPNKPATDLCYNAAVDTILSTMARQLDAKSRTAISAVMGTHNPDSCDVIVNSLVKHGLATKVPGKKGEEATLELREDVRGRVVVAQLYGMKDDLTDRMAQKFVANGKPFAYKYIAYGNLGEVMPFLGRRAIENKSVMSGEGGASAERQRLSGEIWKRLFGGSTQPAKLES